MTRSSESAHAASTVRLAWHTGGPPPEAIASLARNGFRFAVATGMLIACIAGADPDVPRVGATRGVSDGADVRTDASAGPASSPAVAGKRDVPADNAQWIAERQRLTRKLERDPDNVELLSRRGDLSFFCGDFEAALRDYDRMVAVQPRLARSHWRRGIALYFLKRYHDAAHQFADYHHFDAADRENGMWHFLSFARHKGLDSARAAMLRYTRRDRPPMTDLYRVYAGELSPRQFRQHVLSATAHATPAVQFYAHLYLGLYEDLAGDTESAIESLKAAVSNPWPRRAGYGPHYMWHVARLRLRQLGAGDADEPADSVSSRD